MDMEMVMVKGQLERQDLTQLAFVNFWHRKLRAREVPGDQMLAANCHKSAFDYPLARLILPLG